jgi:hypothetical protein
MPADDITGKPDLATGLPPALAKSPVLGQVDWHPVYRVLDDEWLEHGPVSVQGQGQVWHSRSLDDTLLPLRECRDRFASPARTKAVGFL